MVRNETFRSFRVKDVKLCQIALVWTKQHAKLHENDYQNYPSAKYTGTPRIIYFVVTSAHLYLYTCATNLTLYTVQVTVVHERVISL